MMTIARFAAVLAIACLPAAGLAQVTIPGGAQAEAQARLVCGSGTVLNATYLPGGLLRVTCRANSTQTSQGTTTSELPPQLQGTALAPAAAGVVAVVVVAAIVGDDDTSTTTTSTTTSTLGE